MREGFVAALSELPAFRDLSGIPDDGVSDAVSRTGPGVLFFGFRPKSVIEAVLPVFDVSVMPSRFLETFGLSALESLSAGGPVCGIRKGGLSAFVPE